MIFPMSDSAKCERSTVYLDISSPKLRNPVNRNRSRRYSVSFDGRTAIVDPRMDDILSGAKNGTNVNVPHCSIGSSMNRNYEPPSDDSNFKVISGGNQMDESRNIMTSSLIEEKYDDKSPPVNRELAVQLLKEYVKSLKDFSSLLKLRQNRETKDSSTSPIHSPPVHCDKNFNGAVSKLQWSNPNSSVNKNTRYMSSDLFQEKPPAAISNCSDDFPITLNRNSSTAFQSQHTSIPANSLECTKQQAHSSNMRNEQQKNKELDVSRFSSQNGVESWSQTELPKKVIFRKFFQVANEPSSANQSSGYSGVPSVESSSHWSDYPNKSDWNSDPSTSNSLERSRTNRPMSNLLSGNLRSEAAFHRQYTQMLWPADVPTDSGQQGNKASIETTSLEFQASPNAEHRRASSELNSMKHTDLNSHGRLMSPTNNIDPFGSSKSRGSTIASGGNFQPGTFRRGGSVSPSIRLGSSARFNATQQAFGKHLNTSSSARVLLSPPYLGSTISSGEARRPTRPFASSFEQQLLHGSSPSSMQAADHVKPVQSANSYVYHHKVTKEGEAQNKSVSDRSRPTQATSTYVTLHSSDSELSSSGELIRETPPAPSPSMHSPTIATAAPGSRSTSFDCFNSKGIVLPPSASSFGNRSHSSQMSPDVYRHSVDREVTDSTTPHHGFRRQLSDFGPSNRWGRDQNYRFTNREPSDSRSSTTLPFSSSDARGSGPDVSKSLPRYNARRMTTPIFGTNQTTGTGGQQTTAWTTVSRTDDVRRPLGVKTDETSAWKTDARQSSNGSLVVQKLDTATQTEDSPSSQWPLSLDGVDATMHRHLSNESLQSDVVPGGPVLQTWPLSLQSVVKSSDLDSEVEQVTMHNEWGTNSAKIDRPTMDDDSLTEYTQTSGSPTPVPSPTPMSQMNRSAFSQPLMRRHSMRGTLSERPSVLITNDHPTTRTNRLSLLRPFRSSLGSPTCNSTTATETPRCRSVHFSTDVLVAHTGNGPEPLMLSSAPLKEPAPCDDDDDDHNDDDDVGKVNEDSDFHRTRPFSKPFAITPRRFGIAGRASTESIITSQNYPEFQISNNPTAAQPRLPRPTPFRRTVVPRGASEPNL